MTKRQVNRRLETGEWKTVFRAVYRLPGSVPSQRQQLKAAALWAGKGYAFSHHCAAALHGFVRLASNVVELTTERNLRAEQSAVIHVVRDLSFSDVTMRRGFRVTTVTRTLIDLAENAAFKDVRANVDQALHHKWTTLRKLDAALQINRPGVPALRSLVRHYLNGGKPAESELEARAFELFEAGGLPLPAKQEAIEVNGRKYRVDFHVRGTRLIVEADGYAFHSGDGYETDRTRDIVLESHGYVVQRWTWTSIAEQPQLLIDAARRVIALGPRPEDLVKAVS
ncbi:MAG: DUF559 domain-containing protein [Myxococcaceae bacterium]